MKKVAIIILLALSTVLSYSQTALSDAGTINKVNFLRFDIGSVDADTVLWFRVKGNQPIDLTVDFTGVSADSVLLDVYKGTVREDTIYHTSLGSAYSLDLPMYLVKANSRSIVEADTMASVSVISDYWTGLLLGVYLNPEDDVTGEVVIIIDR